MEEHEFDVVVIGAGPVGENVADRTVKGGLTTAIVESELVGGECSYWACMPSKALIRPIQALDEARSVAGSKQAVTGPLDVGAVLGRRDSFTSHWNDDGQAQWLRDSGIALFRGQGRLAGRRAVTVGDGVRLTARHAVVVSTGSDASMLPVPGLTEANPWTSRQATSAQSAPGRLVVMGGGVVGCEMTQAWRAMGSEVTLVERSDHLLMGHEPFAGEMVAEAMRADGVTVLTGRQAASVSREGGSGAVIVVLDDGTEVVGDELLVAAGRHPRTGDIGLETVGLEPGSWLEVDDSMRVTAVAEGWLYATGDVNHRALLTHQGKYQARICGDVISARAAGEPSVSDWSRFSATADHAAVPAVVFTRPEVGGVGLTSAVARDRGLNVRVVDIPISVAGSSLFADGYQGRAAIVVDEDRRVIVGATFVGPGIAELLHSATVAVVGEVPVDRLWHAVPSYPTISEVWLRLLEGYGL
ncbi:MAG TPA: NAD(P)/FAD-dependent oxidoreductase [Acidimicrobiales bacterium]|nr:NAD(P)/FAD-dependent oxidoreductase [Acidimicrobiales bacterium]